MPTAATKKRAQTKKRQGKAPTTQAGEFVREQMHKKKRGRGAAKSRRQAIAIGLSEARRSGIKVGQPRSKRQTKSSSKRSRSKSKSRS